MEWWRCRHDVKIYIWRSICEQRSRLHLSWNFNYSWSFLNNSKLNVLLAGGVALPSCSLRSLIYKEGDRNFPVRFWPKKLKENFETQYTHLSLVLMHLCVLCLKSESTILGFFRSRRNISEGKTTRIWTKTISTLPVWLNGYTGISISWIPVLHNPVLQKRFASAAHHRSSPNHRQTEWVVMPRHIALNTVTWSCRTSEQTVLSRSSMPTEGEQMSTMNGKLYSKPTPTETKWYQISLHYLKVNLMFTVLLC